MKPKLVKVLKLGLPLLLGVLLVAYSLSQISIDELLVYFKKANYTYVVLGVCFGLLSHLSRAYRWRFQLEPMGYHIKLGNSIMAVFATYLINYTIPRAGEVARASIVSNYEGVPFEKAFGTIVSERIADMLLMLMVIVIALLLQFDFIYGFLSKKLDPTKIVIALALFLLAVMVFIRFIKYSTKAIVIKIKVFINGLLEGVLSILKMKKKWAYLAHTIFIWTMYVLMFYISSFALEEMHGVPFPAILVGFIAASFSIAATNGGIGSYPEAIVLVFTTLFFLPEDPSRAFGWIIWTSQTVLILVLGGLSLVYLPIFNKNSASA